MVQMISEPALTPSSSLGPYRREDYLRLPDEPRCERLYGRLIAPPSLSLLHQVLVTLIAKFLDDVAQASGGIAAVAPLDVVWAPHSIVQPDVVYVRGARRDILGERIEGAPDLVVEVLSPSTARYDRGEKLRLYAESGVTELWLVDPAAKQIEILINRDGRFEVALPLDDRYRSEALPEVDLDVAALWHAVGKRLG